MKNLNRKKYSKPPQLRRWWLGIVLLFHAHLQAQTKLQVVTKHIEKTFAQMPTLQIEAEKADIDILVWDKAEFKINIELTAKNPDRQLAVADLELIKYVAEKIGNGIFLRNYLVLDNPKDKPSSNFKAKYSIRIPKETAVVIKNNFGKISIKGLTKKVEIKAEFCKIELEDLLGSLKIDTHYGEVSLKNISTKLMANIERSDLIISLLSGECKLTSSYGKIEVVSVKNLEKLMIDAQKTVISLNNVAFKNHDFRIETSHGELKVPPIFSLKENTENSKIALLNNQKTSKINIKNSFGSTTIE
jgi:hypothetical protein